MFGFLPGIVFGGLNKLKGGAEKLGKKLATGEAQPLGPDYSYLQGGVPESSWMSMVPGRREMQEPMEGGDPMQNYWGLMQEREQANAARQASSIIGEPSMPFLGGANEPQLPLTESERGPRRPIRPPRYAGQGGFHAIS